VEGTNEVRPGKLYAQEDFNYGGQPPPPGGAKPDLFGEKKPSSQAGSRRDEIWQQKMQQRSDQVAQPTLPTHIMQNPAP
jgi:hypothetical protein